MLFTQDRRRSRHLFIETFRKHRAGESLEPLERQVATLLDEHPEYHVLMTQTETVTDKEFHADDGVENPFLHLGLHLALREQVGTDRPRGIADITRALLQKYKDGHYVEHLMMECLGEMLWDSQRQGVAPDEWSYLEKLKKL